MFHGDASSAISSSGCALPALLTLLSSPPIYSTACQERGSLTQPLTLPMWAHTCLASMCGRGVSGGGEVKNEMTTTPSLNPSVPLPCTPPSPRVCLEAGCPNGAREGSVLGGRRMRPPAHTPFTTTTLQGHTARPSPTTPQQRELPPSSQHTSADGGCHCATQRCTHGLTAPTTSGRGR